MAKHCKLESAIWSLLDDKASRNSPIDLGGAKKRGNPLYDANFWCANIRVESVS